MANDRVQDTLEEVAAGLVRAEAALPEAQALLNILIEAGEPSEEVRALVAETRLKIVQWKRTLQRHGITLPSIEEVTPE